MLVMVSILLTLHTKRLTNFFTRRLKGLNHLVQHNKQQESTAQELSFDHDWSHFRILSQKCSRSHLEFCIAMIITSIPTSRKMYDIVFLS